MYLSCRSLLLITFEALFEAFFGTIQKTNQKDETWKISKLCNCIVYNQKVYGRIQTLFVHLKVFYYVLLTIWLYELSIPLGMPGEIHRTLPA